MLVIPPLFVTGGISEQARGSCLIVSAADNEGLRSEMVGNDLVLSTYLFKDDAEVDCHKNQSTYFAK
jgi:hypothetical protein